jgi:hypothetical protein
MNLARIKTLAPLLVLACASFGAARSTLIAPLDNQRAIRGCSWNAVAPSIGPGYIFLAEWDESKVLMNIGGSDVELTITGDADKRPSRASPTVKVYRGASGIEVRATYTVTWDCSQSDNESCEVTKYDVKFEVTKGDEAELVQATGEVGC